MATPTEWIGVGPRPLFSPATAVVALLPHGLLIVALTLPHSLLRQSLAVLIIYLLWFVNNTWRIGVPFNDVGLGIMTAFYSCRVIELLLVSPPELSGVQRVLVEPIPPLEQAPPPSSKDNLSAPAALHSSADTIKQPLAATSNAATVPSPPPPTSTTVLEPIPPPYTLEKLYWAANLWSNYRGIGWTYQAPLARQALRDPFLRSSSPRAFLRDRVLRLLFVLFITDALSTLLVVEPRTRAYFSAIEGVSPKLADQSVLWRALWSVCVVTFTWASMELSYVATAISLVSVGAMLGWKGAMWEPWGWPPLFDFRRVLFTLAWSGLGERVLGLSTTSNSPPPSTTSTPNLDGTSTNNTITPKRPLPPGRPPQHLLANLLKSLLVFTLTGLLHEAGNLSVGPVLPKVHSHTRSLPFIGTTTLFFAVQPLAIAAEAIVKSFWRQFKASTSSGVLSAHAQTLERAVGFAWTWWWLGTTAAWVVEDWSKRGFYGAKLAEWSVIRLVWKGTFWV
ncbi:hypothetical protein RQP46_000333 [Phenoliferia psychrophenolica]